MFKCIGCDSSINWDGEILFSYTCPCGATIFYREGDEGRISLPASVALGISKGRALPHLEDLVGESEHSSPYKEAMINELVSRGFTWMKDCEQCAKDGTLKRYEDRRSRDKRREEVRQQAKEEDWDIEKTIQELVKADKWLQVRILSLTQ